MGFFSWRTADHGETIPSIHAKEIDPRPIYLLQPYGKPIKETAYDGYGRFAMFDLYNFLAWKNGHGTKKDMVNDCEEQRMTGIMLSFGTPMDPKTGVRWSFHEYPGTKKFPGNYEHPIEEYGGKTPNQLLFEGTWIRAGFDLKFELKFSYNPKAKYKKLPASKSCPYQGYFYPYQLIRREAVYSVKDSLMLLVEEVEKRKRIENIYKLVFRKGAEDIISNVWDTENAKFTFSEINKRGYNIDPKKEIILAEEVCRIAKKRGETRGDLRLIEEVDEKGEVLYLVDPYGQKN